ncbi:protein of unknown function [Vibrio tapetis subsp. tapetis]|uniref:Uncharacterized protein n=1 Tax=Vibrio tapetis subsp. tapetis TaxID=1671868 RepID=A0A2N8ZH89_9VIBR|nr:protein of unknown function [Vibrio tapetis subsp. tapetis]
MTSPACRVEIVCLKLSMTEFLMNTLYELSVQTIILVAQSYLFIKCINIHPLATQTFSLSVFTRIMRAKYPLT